MAGISDALFSTGVHEAEIRSYFPERFVWQGSSPVFETPLYILAFTNRSGSNLLADYLRQTGKLHGFGEGLNYDEVRRRSRIQSVESFPDYIRQLAVGEKRPGAWGIKATWDQVILMRRANIFAMFSGVRIIHSVREDVLGQAISHCIAHQTRKWTSTQDGLAVEPKFSQDQIEGVVMDTLRSNGYISLISEVLNAPRHVVIYERLQKSPASEIRELAHALSIDVEGWTPRHPLISMQRDEVNDTFRHNCLEFWGSFSSKNGDLGDFSEPNSNADEPDRRLWHSPKLVDIKRHIRSFISTGNRK